MKKGSLTMGGHRSWLVPVLLTMLLWFGGPAPARGQGTITPLQTGGGGVLSSVAQELFVSNAVLPFLRFNFGFATEETPVSETFFDSATLTLQGAGSYGILASVDAMGAAWAPGEAGAGWWEPGWIWRLASPFPSLNPVLPAQMAWLVYAPLPAGMIGQTVTLFLDLFDNQDTNRSLAWIGQATIVANPHFGAPLITTNPASQAVVEGTPVRLEVAVNAVPEPSYQWRKNGADIPDATNAFLSFDPAQFGHGGGYDVVAVNSYGAVTSAVATLNVQPFIGAQSLAVAEDSSASIRLGSATNALGQPLLYAPLRPALHGDLVFNGNSVLYTPAPNFNGADSFGFSVQVGGVEIGRADVTLAITATDDFRPYLFGEGVALPTGRQPSALVAGVFGKDPKLDLAVAHRGDNAVGIYHGNGNGGFTLSNLIQTAAAGARVPVALAAGDFGGDTRLDLAVACLSNSAVLIYTNNASGTFSAPATLLPARAEPVALAAGQFNKDRWLELAVANYSSATVEIWANRTNYWTNLSVIPVPAGPVALLPADFDQDRKTDLVVACAQANQVSLWRGLGTGFFTFASNYTVGGGPVALAAGDFNGDKRLDLAVAQAGSGKVTVLTNNGPGGLAVSSDYQVGLIPSNGPSAVVAMDLNMDGKLDLAVALAGDNAVVVLLGNGDGTFDYFFQDPATYYPAGEHPVALAAGRFNSDTGPDLVAANFASDDLTLWLNNYQPRAYKQKLTTWEDTALSVTLLGSYGPLDYVITRPPALGSWTTSNSLTNTTKHPVLRYTPFTNLFGTDVLDYYVTDGFKTSTLTRVTINILPVNDPPSFELSRVLLVVGEDAGAVKLTNFAVNISKGPTNEAAQTLRFLVSPTDPAKTNLFAGPLGQPKVSSRGVLSFTPAKNAYGAATFAIVLQDSGAAPNRSATNWFDVVITNVNDAPVISSPVAALTIPEDTSTNLVVHVGDLESAPGDLNLIVLSTNQALVASSTNAGQTNLAIEITGPNNADRRITLWPAANQAGSTLLTLIVDDGQNSASRSLKLTVTAVNDPPSFTLAPAFTNLAVRGNQGFTNRVVAAASPGPNETSQTLAYLITNPKPGLFAAPPRLTADGTLTFKTKPLTNETAVTLDIRVKDNGLPPLTNGTQQIHLTIRP